MGDKLRTPYNSIACRSTFSSNNLKYTFSVWLYQSLTSFWKNLGPHFFTMLIQFICLCTALASAFQAGCGLDFDWAITTPWLFSFQPFCWRFTGVLGSLSCCMTQFWPCFSCHTDGLTFVHGRLSDCEVPRPCGYKTSPKSSALHQPAWLLVWGVCADKLFWLSPNVALCIMVIHLHFGHCSRSLMVCSNAAFQNNYSGNPKHAIHTCPFLIVVSQTLSFYMLTEACRVWGVALGLSAICQRVVRSEHGWIFWDIHSWEDWSWMSSTCE